MSRSNILALVEALRQAGLHTSEPNMPLGPAGKDWCPECGHIDNSKKVDAAAKALVAEIEKQPYEKFPLKNPQEILHIPEVP